MARIPEAELERLKREVRVERLAEARGVELARHGADLRGLCPFHEDREPSLVITPEKNLWHCLGACQTGGSVVDWVMRAEGVSFRHAAELLRADWAPGASATSRPVKISTTVKLPGVLDAEEDDAALLRRVVDYYHSTLSRSPAALGYLAGRGLRHPEMVEHFRLGYADRSLAYRLPAKNRREGARIRERLQGLGVLRASGHEHLNGSVVVPVFDAEGRVAELYGRKITPNLRVGTPRHLYLPGPHRGVWNVEALAASREIILCESLLDALTFWCAGFRHVTAAYGTAGVTPDHWRAFERYGTERVLIAYDRDEAGEAAAEQLAAELAERGIGAYRIQFPRGLDANAYAQKVQPAARSLELLIRNAIGLGKGPAPALSSSSQQVASAEEALIEEAESEERAAEAMVGEPPVPAPQEPRFAMSDADASAQPEPAPPRTVDPPADVSASEEPPPLAARQAATAGRRAQRGEACDAERSSSRQAATAGRRAQRGGACDAEQSSSRQAATAGRRAQRGRSEAQPERSSSSSAPTPAQSASPGTTEQVVAEAAPPAASSPTEPPAVEQRGDEVVMRMGDRRWRVRGLAKNKSHEVLRVNVLVARGEAFHVDTFDLYVSKSRQQFVAQAAAELEVEERGVKADLGQVLQRLEVLQEEQIRRALEPEQKTVVVTDAEREEALELLRDPDLLDRILRDFDRCGVVGEETNKLTCYLAAISRKLEEPLAVAIQSSSAAGKSSLMEAVLDFVPED